MGLKKPGLEWEEKYSVEVAEIDNQHKLMFGIINELIDTIGTAGVDESRIGKIIASILEYKSIHFQTEENYFKKFAYSGAEEHIAQHEEFKKKLGVIQEQNAHNKTRFVFELVDFLEDWMIDHLMNVDQKYKECFKSHGLK